MATLLVDSVKFAKIPPAYTINIVEEGNNILTNMKDYDNEITAKDLQYEISKSQLGIKFSRPMSIVIIRLVMMELMLETKNERVVDFYRDEEMVLSCGYKFIDNSTLERHNNSTDNGNRLKYVDAKNVLQMIGITEIKPPADVKISSISSLVPALPSPLPRSDIPGPTTLVIPSAMRGVASAFINVDAFKGQQTNTTNSTTGALI